MENIMSSRTEVLVTGAGPVGLSAALALAQAGVSIRIIDRLTVPTNQSRAAIVHARTLEHFERLGIVDDFLAVGVKVHGAAIYGPGDVLLVRPSFDYLPTPYPFMIGLEQFKTESLLTKRLKEAGVEVERGVELTSFQDAGDHVSARLRHPDGRETTEQFAYLVGTDGGHSTVRAGLGLQLEGETLDATWVTADVKMRWKHDPDEVVAYLSEEGIAFIAAMNDDRWRVIVNVPQMPREEAEKATVEDIQTIVCERFRVNVALYDPVWISAFGINTRMASTMSVGRVFLAGDAAHVHSPVGGQGMNTGIQDSLNLAWKLALVLRGTAKPELLESYNAERHYNAKRLLSRVGRATRMANLRQPVAIEVRNQVIHLLGHLGIGRVMPQFVSMLDVGYPESPAVTETHISWLSRGPRAGERAPDAEGLLSAGKPESQRLFTLWSGDDRHQLLVFGNGKDGQVPASSLYAVTRIVREGTPSEGVIVDAEGHAHEAYAAHREGALYLVRPDGIIAFRSGEPDTNVLSEYLARWYR
jgi:2-polyprenyl-6-methoxyphenol hydroxylase-like FAD-dependent oxidoreductase